MAKRKTMAVVMRAAYHGKDGKIMPGESIDLPVEEAQRLIDGGHAVDAAGASPVSPRLNPSNLQSELAQKEQRIAELESELATKDEECSGRLAEAQKYAESLESRLRDAGLWSEVD